MIEFGSARTKDGTGKVSFSVRGQEPFAIGGPRTTWRVEPAKAGAVRVFKNGTKVTVDGDETFGSRSRRVSVRYEEHGTLLRVVDEDNRYR